MTSFVFHPVMTKATIEYGGRFKALIVWTDGLESGGTAPVDTEAQLLQPCVDQPQFLNAGLKISRRKALGVLLD